MNIPKIYAKASFTKEQIQAKVEIGCDGLEIQLLQEAFKDLRWKSFDTIYDIENLINYPIKAIHAPLLKDFGDMTIENMFDVFDMPVLFEMFRVADLYGRKQNEIITLIIHTEENMETLTFNRDTYHAICRQFDVLFNMYDNVKVGFENVSPLRSIGKEKPLALSNNFRFDNIELAKKLRNDLGSDRVGTILDTCHAMLSEKYITSIYEAVGDRPIDDNYSLDNYFKQNKEYIYHIHFADMKGSGYGKGRHGIPFTEENKDRAYNILDIYHKYNYDCPLCLEIEEFDFINCPSYKSTKDIIMSYYIDEDIFNKTYERI